MGFFTPWGSTAEERARTYPCDRHLPRARQAERFIASGSGNILFAPAVTAPAARLPAADGRRDPRARGSACRRAAIVAAWYLRRS